MIFPETAIRGESTEPDFEGKEERCFLGKEGAFFRKIFIDISLIVYYKAST